MKHFLYGLIFILNIMVLAKVGAFQVEVAQFQYHGPSEHTYLASAAQDSIVASLNQNGYQVNRLNKVLNPDLFKATQKGRVWILGRIHLVGQQVRVLVKWKSSEGSDGEKFLQVKDLNDFLPQIENYARLQLSQDISRETRLVETQKPVETPPSYSQKPQKPEQNPQVSNTKSSPKSQVEPVEIRKEKTEEKKESFANTQQKTQQSPALQDYQVVSQRLPYEIRSIAYGDLDQDGIKELCATSQNTLYVYHMNQGELKLLTKYQGKKSDYFVKLDVLPAQEGQGPLLALTNLKSNYAASQLLKLNNGELEIFIKDIPYQLRVMQEAGTARLLGAAYYGRKAQNQSVYQLAIQENKIQVQDKLEIPKVSSLYSFQKFVQNNSILTMSDLGKLNYYKNESGKLEKIWSSRASYGVEGNYIPVSVKNVFNEEIASYYSIPVEFAVLDRSTQPEFLAVQSDSLVKNVIGKVPLVADSQLVRLQWDEIGFSETWMSKKIDGSIQDFLVDEDSFQKSVLLAVRLRQGGVFGAMEANESILLKFDLN